MYTMRRAVGFVLPGVIYFVHFFWRGAGNIGTACMLTGRGEHATPGKEEEERMRVEEK